MIEYKFNKEFPMPFTDGYTSIDSQDSMALQWLQWNFTDDFKAKVIDKLNGKTVNFNGTFFISNNQECNCCFKDQNADGNHNKLYFLENGKVDPIAMLMVRGWGHLTGCGGLNIEPKKAAEIQDGFLDWVRDTLNFNFENVQCYNETLFVIDDKSKDDEPLVELIPENARIESKFVTYDSSNMHKTITDVWTCGMSCNITLPPKTGQEKWYMRYLRKKK